jgi:hypothetical protein
MKRSYLIASTIVLLLAIGISLAALRYRHQRQLTAWQTLLSFENQDLSYLKPDANPLLKGAIENLTGTSDPKVIPYEPRLFRTMVNAAGETRYVLVEERPLVMIPSESRLRIHVFDTNGHSLSQSDFSAGWRTVLTVMHIRKNFFFNRDTLVVYGQYCLGGSPSTQHYVLVGNSIILAYLETNGEFHRNDYTDANSRIGPLFERSTDEWEAALNSNDIAQVTSALIWLGGAHWNGEAPPYDQDKHDAQKVSTLLARDSVKKRIDDLTKSNYSWVSIAARSVFGANGT